MAGIILTESAGPCLRHLGPFFGRQAVRVYPENEKVIK